MRTHHRCGVSWFIVNIPKRNLNADPALIGQNNTYHFLEQNHGVVREHGITFRLICGDKDSWMQSAVTFQKALRAKDIPCDLTLVPSVAHSLSGLTKAEGKAAARFQDKVFQTTLGN
jgi:acetyl esterase/lipase